MKNEIHEQRIELQEYFNTFIPPGDKYGRKNPSGRWFKKDGCPNSQEILDHLENPHGIAIATKAKWYPSYAAIDFDDFKLLHVEKIREQLGMNQSNSFLFASESVNSYHLFFKPRYGEKETHITTRLLHEAVKPFVKHMGAELYPQRKKLFRAPLGARSSMPVDHGREWLENWQDKLYWLEKIDAFDVLELPLQLEMFKPAAADNSKHHCNGHYGRGKELLEYGLQVPRSRNESQFCVLYYLWRVNTPPESAKVITLKWLRKKHNGKSKDIHANKWRDIERELDAQIATIWNYTALPDYPHNEYDGTIAKSDIIEIVRMTKASLPKLKFLFEFAKWYRPRRNRRTVNCHRDNLVRWASTESYLKRLNELEEMGILTRDSGYVPGLMSKQIKLKWKYGTDKSILVDNRSVCLHETLKASFEGRELGQLLKSSGMNKDNANKFTRIIYDQREVKTEHI